jgi:ubiquinone/menaquinone biosynthesis C-methylase UbiE
MFTTSTEYHDAHAKEYDAGYDAPYWRIYNEITWDYIKSCLPKSKKKSLILDAGGGTGLWAIRIAKLGFRVVLADISRGMLDEARRKIEIEKLQTQIEIVEADITNLKAIRTSTFDLTLAEGDPVSYCENPKKAISELARITKRGGFVTVSVDNKLTWAFRALKAHDFLKAEKALTNGIADMQGEDHCFPAHTFTIEELQALFRKNKLKPIRSVGKPAWANGEDYLSDNEVYERVLRFELKFSSLPSVAGAGGHIAVIGRKT